VRGRHLVAAILENGLPHRRLGLTVSSRVGNAVARNRVKRWLREIFRHHRNALPPGVDVVLIARPGTPQLGHRRLEAEFVTLAERLRAGEGERGRPKSRRRSGTGRRS
jgi:ribonuclease P protein component